MPKTISSKRHKALVELIKAERRKARITQEMLAERLNQQQSFVARMESGQRRIDVVEFLHIAEAIGFNVGDAITRLKRTKP